MLAGIAYEPGSTEFFVRFRDGKVYHYHGGQDTPMIVSDILFSPSQGKAFNVIKSSLPFWQLTETDTPEFHA